MRAPHLGRATRVGRRGRQGAVGAHQAYADTGVLEPQYVSMSRMGRPRPRPRQRGLGHRLPVRRLARSDAPPDVRREPGPTRASSPPPTCPLGRASRRAGALGQHSDTAAYAALAAEGPQPFEAVRRRGRVISDCATVYSLALVVDLLTEPKARSAGHRLAELVAKSGHRVATGSSARRSSPKHWPRPATWTTPTHCCCSGNARPGSTPSRWAPPRSGSAGTRCCPTVRSTPADDVVQPLRARRVADWMHRTIAGIAPTAPGYRPRVVRAETQQRPHLGCGVAGDPARTGSNPFGAHERRRTDETTLPEGVEGVLWLPDGASRA